MYRVYLTSFSIKIEERALFDYPKSCIQNYGTHAKNSYMAKVGKVGEANSNRLSGKVSKIQSNIS